MTEHEKERLARRYEASVYRQSLEFETLIDNLTWGVYN